MVKDIARLIHVCIPFRLLREKYLPLVLSHRFNPEIGLDCHSLDFHSPKVFAEIASLLRREDLAVTLHAPFYDLVPGGIDKKLVQATRDRLKQTFELIPLFSPRSIVCHTGFDRKRYGDVRNEWLETSLETWTPLAQSLKGAGTVLMMENVYEKTPVMLLRLLNGLEGQPVGFCFDAGHMNAFSATDMDGWLEALGPLIRQCHLHDNHGADDEHLAVGAGQIDFERLFEYLLEHGLRPVMTVEAHKEKWLWESLEALSKSERFCRIVQPRLVACGSGRSD